MDIKEVITKAANGQLDEMRDGVKEILTGKAIDVLEQKKVAIAKRFLVPISEQAEPLQELSKEKVGKYINKALNPYAKTYSKLDKLDDIEDKIIDAEDKNDRAGYRRAEREYMGVEKKHGDFGEYQNKLERKAGNRYKGIKTATAKLTGTAKVPAYWTSKSK